MSLHLPSSLHLSPTERRFAVLLSDGLVHSRDEMARLLDDAEMATDTALRMAVSRFRHLINPYGYDVVFSRNSDGYRAVRHIDQDD